MKTLVEIAKIKKTLLPYCWSEFYQHLNILLFHRSQVYLGFSTFRNSYQFIQIQVEKRKKKVLMAAWVCRFGRFEQFGRFRAKQDAGLIITVLQTHFFFFF